MHRNKREVFDSQVLSSNSTRVAFEAQINLLRQALNVNIVSHSLIFSSLLKKWNEDLSACYVGALASLAAPNPCQWSRTRIFLPAVIEVNKVRTFTMELTRYIPPYNSFSTQWLSYTISIITFRR